MKALAGGNGGLCLYSCLLFSKFICILVCLVSFFFFENCIFSINTEKKSRKHYVRNLTETIWHQMWRNKQEFFLEWHFLKRKAFNNVKWELLFSWNFPDTQTDNWYVMEFFSSQTAGWGWILRLIATVNWTILCSDHWKDQEKWSSHSTM